MAADKHHNHWRDIQTANNMQYDQKLKLFQDIKTSPSLQARPYG